MIAQKISMICIFVLTIVSQVLGQRTNSTMPNTKECQACLKNLPQGCAVSIATNPQGAGAKCICSSAFLENFANCGVCSQQFSGLTTTVVPTDADKQKHVQNCASDGMPIANITSTTSAASTLTATSASSLSTASGATTSMKTQPPSSSPTATSKLTAGSSQLETNKVCVCIIGVVVALFM
ncbi:hypothetical protein K7432_005644 [Basidiobolus ranarum]|uniref:Uncharacterized protein n=1 Tax=Basidiobolus ranarum TaxID=34480 RepID=A0ABR2WWB0_9FUNG